MRRVALVVAVVLVGSALLAYAQARRPHDALHLTTIRADDDRLQPPVVLAGSRLVSVRGRFGDPQSIATSDDGGAWSAVALPGAPATLRLDAPHAVDGHVVVLTGTDPASDAYAWVSADGRRWHGGALGAKAGYGTKVTTVGGDVVVVTAWSTRLAIRVTSDRGATWRSPALPAVAVPAGGTVAVATARATSAGGAIVGLFLADEHNVPVGASLLTSTDGTEWVGAPCEDTGCISFDAGDALVHDDTFSIDGGAVFERFRLEPEPPKEQDVPRLQQARDAGDGRWLATASSYVPSDVEFGYLASRAGTGGAWHQLRVGDACGRVVETRPNSSYSLPVPVGDRWLATYSCVDLNTPVDAILVAGRAADDSWSAVAGSRRAHVSYGQPLEVDADTVLVPVVGKDGMLDGLLRVSA